MLGWLSWILIGAPLKYLYFHGPRWIGWEGRYHEDICQEISNVPSEFWSKHALECEQTIDRRFNSMYILVQVFIYCAMVYKGISILIFKYTVTNTLDNYFNKFNELSILHHTRCNDTTNSYLRPRFLSGRRLLSHPWNRNCRTD